jgi:kynurenine 3-monooxygenase
MSYIARSNEQSVSRFLAVDQLQRAETNCKSMGSKNMENSLVRRHPDSIGLIGAGLAGTLLAVYLAQRGISVHLFERRPDIRKSQYSGGRSINLALSRRGIDALAGVGLADTVLGASIPMRGRMIHDLAQQQHFVAYSTKAEECIYSVSRAGLNQLLLEQAANQSNIQLYFEHRCVEWQPGAAAVHFEVTEGGQTSTAAFEFQAVIGTDGASSAIRQAYFNLNRFDYRQDYLGHGYKELAIRPNASGGFQMEPEALHIWPRGDFMLIALPNLDNSFTCTLFLPHHSAESFDSLQTPEAIHHFFEAQFPDTLQLMPDLVEQFQQNPTSNLATIRCYPWTMGNKSTLLGDAAHAIVPFYGQGMNCSFEDCAVLAQCMDQYPADKLQDHWGQIFEQYQQLRKPNTDAIAQLALENFVEMRDHTADPLFMRKRKLEMRLEERFPDQFASKYSLVSFKDVSYAHAWQLGNLQDQRLLELCASVHNIDELDLTQVLTEMINLQNGLTQSILK